MHLFSVCPRLRDARGCLLCEIDQDVCVFHTSAKPVASTMGNLLAIFRISMAVCPATLKTWNAKNVDHGGYATNTQYIPLCNFVSSLCLFTFLSML